MPEYRRRTRPSNRSNGRLTRDDESPAVPMTVDVNRGLCNSGTSIGHFLRGKLPGERDVSGGAPTCASSASGALPTDGMVACDNVTTDAMAVDEGGSTGETTATSGLPADLDGRSAVDSMAPICESAERNEMPNGLSTRKGGTVDELTNGKLTGFTGFTGSRLSSDNDDIM